MSGHHPGPWNYIPPDGWHMPLVQRAPSVPELAILGSVMERAIADAKLIAAAPDLFAALEAAEAYIDKSTNFNPIEMIRDALRKAST